MSAAIHDEQCGCLSHQAVELMQSGCSEDAAFYWAAIIVELHRRVTTLAEIWRGHRPCGPKYEGCYSHRSAPHCRADGMAWPCDVEDIRARLAEGTDR